MSLSSDDFTIAQTTQDKDIIFTVNDGGTTKEALRIKGSTGRIEHLRVGDLTVDGTNTIMNTTTLSVEDNIIELNRNISTASGMPNYTGLKVNRGETSSATEQDLYWVWDETFADDGSTIFGNAGGAWTAFKSGGGDDARGRGRARARRESKKSPPPRGETRGRDVRRRARHARVITRMHAFIFFCVSFNRPTASRTTFQSA